MTGATKDWNTRVLLFKDETTEGTDSIPTSAANAYRVLRYTPTFLDADQKVRQLDKAYFGADPVAMAAFKRGATFDMEMAGAGVAAGTGIPPWMAMLRYCGFAAPVVGANSVSQKPTTPNILSASHWAYIDDLLLKTIGMRGSVGFTIEDDEWPVFNFNVLGRPPASLADQAVPTNPTIPATYIDPVLARTESTTITYGSYAYGVRRITMSDGAQIALRSLINPQDKVAYTGRAWTGQLVIEVPDITVANANPFTGIAEGTTRAATIVHGVTAGNIVQIDMPKLQVTGNPELSEEDGKTMATFPITALPVTGNDEIVFTTK